MAAATPITTAATEDNNHPRLSSSDETAAGQFSDAAPVQPVVVGVKRKQLGMFSRPSCVVLLKNMVALEEVDDQLGAETTQECLKYGPVHSCLIYTEPRRPDQQQGGASCPEEERVRTFVEFERQDSAIRAFR